jgi:hypothetical protein
MMGCTNIFGPSCWCAIAIALSAAGASLIQAKEPALDTTFWNERYEAAKKFMVSMPRPEYPVSARSLRQQGSGLTGCTLPKAAG